MSQPQKRSTFFLVLGIFLLGACMRTPITSVPSIINDIAKTVDIESSNLGVLTTLPVLCFGLFASIVPSISRKIGNELAITIALALLFIGSYLRIINTPLLFIGTLVLGIGTTFINVLLPAIITERAPNKVGILTSVYTFSLAFSSSIGAGFSSSLAKATNWQFVIQVLSMLVLTTFILWLPNLKSNTIKNPIQTTTNSINPWKNKNAWLMLFYFGLSSFTFYTLVAWLPTIAIQTGISENNASLLAGLFQLVSIIPPFFIPSLAVKMKNRSLLIICGAGSTSIGVIGLLLPINSIIFFVIINVVLGIATAITFTLIMTLFSLKTKSPTETTRISGMSQSVGYLLASLGPISTGFFKNITGSWHTSELLILLIIVLFTLAGISAEKNKYIFK